MNTGGPAVTILLVEDNVDNRIIMKAWLEHAGYRVLLAVDGVASLTMAQAMLPDIILMDVALPGMDGWDAADCLKTHPETQSIPIIALTALALPDDRRRASEARIDGYLTKPVALSRVLEEVERVLCA
jgi:CheY-like chemotaxis protein